jgi:polar amino acid transport system substrate-binding protein
MEIRAQMSLLRRCWVCLFIVAVFLGVFAPAGGRSATLDEILKSGQIRVGVNPTLAPRAMYDDKNEITGFEPEIAAEIARRLGVKLVLVPVGSPDRIPFVAANRVDVVMGAMSRTSERAKVIDFTFPLHSENYGIVTRDDTGITSLADLNKDSVTLVEVRGTVMVTVLQKRVPNAKMLLLDNYDDRDRAIAQGRATASVDGIDTAAFRLKPYGSVVWKMIALPELGVTWDCLGVAKGNTTLRDYLNIALYEMHTSGDVERIWEKWFGRPMDTKVPTSPFF